MMRYHNIMFAVACMSAVGIKGCDDLTFVALEQENHIEQTHALIMKNIEKVHPHLPADLEERKQKIQALDGGIKEKLADNVPLSHFSYKDNSFQRFVLITDNKTVNGVVDYFVQPKDNKGYIQTLCTDSGYELYIPELIKLACDQLKGLEAQSVLTHVQIGDVGGAARYKALDFKQLEQGPQEKRFGVFAFEYTFPQ